MRISCPQCEKPLRCDNDQIGRVVICPSCKQRMRIGDPSELESSRGRSSRRERCDRDEPEDSESNAPYWLIAWLAFVAVLPCLGCTGWLTVASICASRPMQQPTEAPTVPSAVEQNVNITSAGQVTVNQNTPADPIAGNARSTTARKNR